MSRTKLHIVTLGTSILINLKKKPDLKAFADMPPPGPGLENWLAEARKRGTWKDLLEQAEKALSKDPYGLSAELNAMRDFLEAPQARLELEVYLIVTDTEAGSFCREAISRYLNRYLNKRGVRDSLLGYYKQRSDSMTPEESFASDLKTLFEGVIRIIQKHRKDCDILINATGGFKPETAVLSIVGNLFMVPVYYIHETFRKRLEIPPLIPPKLYPRDIRILKDIYEAPDRRITDKFKIYWPSQRDQIERLEKFGVLRILRDKETGAPYGLELTYQGKFWVELDAQGEFWS